MEDHYTGYSELLVNGLERMLKQLNQRKYKQIQESIKNAIEQVKSEKGAPATELDANKYFPIFEKCLETKITKVLEAGLYYIQKLVSHGYVNGKQAQMEPIIKAICSCAYQIDDNVQLQVIKCLLTMVTSLTCEVHGNSLIEGFQACYHIHISSKNVINQTTAKGALTQMLSVVFQRMESNTLAENPQAYYKFYEGQQFYGEEELSESALYRSLSALVKNMVDDVQLYQAKVDQYPDDVHYIPLRSVPFVMNPDDPCFSKLKVVYIQNELNKVSGKFGWCVVCRNTADLYCKDTRDPICSKRCKDLHMKNLQDADQWIKGQQKQEDTKYLQDAVLIYRLICKLSLTEWPNAPEVFTLKSKILSLELILSIYDSPGPTFLSRSEFIEIVKKNLCESILKNSVSQQKTILALSLSIFLALVTYFKESLKSEIAIFIEQIFLKILESPHSQTYHKNLVLQVFYKLTQSPRISLELFINYDCDLEQKSIFGRMIDCISRIAQGESELRALALQTLVTILKSCFS